jgi:hypothetical protein
MLAHGRESLLPVQGQSPPRIIGCGLGKTTHERHQPEQTLLYQLVDAYYPALVDQLVQVYPGVHNGAG